VSGVELQSAAAATAVRQLKLLALRRALQWGWLGILVVSVLAAALSLPKGRAQPLVGDDDAPVLAAETALGEALRNGDKPAARKLLSLQFTFVNADGSIHTRKEFLADLRGVASAAQAGEPHVRLYGLLAMVTGHRTSARGDDVVFLDIWARQRGAWRALLIQEVAISAAEAPASTVTALASEIVPYACKNPCQAIPYRVRSAAEQDIITAFQAIETAVAAHDADEWGKHVADEFVRYTSSQPPITKADRIAALERQKEANAAVTVGEVETMRLAVYGDGAAMIASHVMPDNSRPPYRAARVWVRRNGKWQMAISVQTEIK